MRLNGTRRCYQNVNVISNTTLSMEGEDNDYAWQPPSEAEMKIIRARRERDNKISQRMGDYLLKGYKMLGVLCPLGNCGTILLQDKQGKNYCIACNELETDVDKDDPVRNQEAALAQVREQELSSRRPETPQTPPVPPQAPATNQPHPADNNSHQAENNSHPVLNQPIMPQSLQPASNSRPNNERLYIDQQNRIYQPRVELLSPQLENSIDILTNKISWASEELGKSSSVEYSIQLCQLIKHSADAIHSLKSAG